MDIYREITAIRERVSNLERIEQPAKSGGLPVYPTLTLGSILFASVGGVLAQDNSNLFWDDANNRLTIAGLQLLGAGTSFPVSPPTNGVYYRTDLGWWCQYDGTRWLTVHDYTVDADTSVTPADISGPYEWQIRQDFNPYVTRVTTTAIVATTNNGSNYWTVRFRGLILDRSGATTIHDFTTASDSPGGYILKDATPTATQTPANDNTIQVFVQKTGTPGALTLVSASVSYRLIVT